MKKVVNNYHELSLHDKAVRLCEGGVVECDGHFVRAIKIPLEIEACMNCDMDSACLGEMANLCCECDEYEGITHILKFAYKQK